MFGNADLLFGFLSTEEWNDVPPTSLAPVLPPPPPPPLPPFLLPEVMSGTFAATPIPPGVSVVPRGTDIVPPPPDIQPIIDKLANYVARNGADFETIVKAKNDDRFAFLNPWDVHHPYYLYKKQLCREEKEKEELGKQAAIPHQSVVIREGGYLLKIDI